MAGKEKKPEIRFTGFTDAWEQRRLSDISDKVIEKNATLEFTETFTNSAEFGIISQRDFFDHDISNIENLDGYYVVKNEDFVYNPRISTSAPVGPINRNKLGRNGVMSPLYTVFRTHDIDNTFLEKYFKSRYWHSYMKLNGDSGARSDRFSIKDSVFIEMPIPYPNLKEQLKIGEYLTKLDNLITSHQRKRDKLVAIKKSMLEKMFPKDGANVPEIRFAGFTDAWEKFKVSDVLTEQSRPIEMDDKETYELITVKRRNGGIVSRGYYKGKDILVKNYYEVHEGDYVISKRQIIHGANGIVPKSLDKSIVSNEYLVCSGNEHITSEFWVLMSKLPEMYRLFFLSSYGVDMEKMVFNVEDWKKRMITIPSIPEQNKIIEYFATLDNLITLHQRKLEKLKNIKQSMLDKMFV